ncbi:MAG TPA: hypothetical protein VMD53_05425 [Rhizomicrobium sp.]|nr:hypothetical protein [Rhizomicrobium sp.]
MTKTKKKPAAKKKSAAEAKKASRGLTEAQFKKIALTFPGTSEGSSYGSPAILLLNKFFTRLRSEDDSIVLKVSSIDERDMLLQADPATFHITDHYKNYPALLARLEKLDPATLKTMLERRWLAMVPKKMQKEFPHPR